MNRRSVRIGLLAMMVGGALGCGSGSDSDERDASTSADAGRSDAQMSGGDEDAGEPGEVVADVTAVRVSNESGGAPAKGDVLHVVLTVANTGTGSGTVRVTPRISSQRFADFTDVPLGSVDVELSGGVERDVTLRVEPFVIDDARGKHYALNRGDYTVTGVDIEQDGGVRVDSSVGNAAFTIAPSNVVLNAVMYDPIYFERISYAGTPEEYMTQAFTRRSELYTPEGNRYDIHEGGFDQMMGVRQLFHVVPGLAANDGSGFCEQVAAFARTALGLTRDWDADENQPSHTDVDHHGFDILVGLTQNMGGGAACGWLDVQVSGLFDFDLSLERAQIILVHETGHIFGAPHCDPLQGYVMCAGEQHDHYRNGGVFVWHRVSRDVMSNRWN